MEYAPILIIALVLAMCFAIKTFFFRSGLNFYALVIAGVGGAAIARFVDAFLTELLNGML